MADLRLTVPGGKRLTLPGASRLFLNQPGGIPLFPDEIITELDPTAAILGWWDYSDPTYYTASGGAISAALDRGPNGYDLDNVGPVEPPAEILAYQNGLNSAQFLGPSKDVDGTIPDYTIFNKMTVFVVGSLGTTGQGEPFFNISDSTGNSEVQVRRNSGFDDGLQLYVKNGANTVFNYNLTVPDTAPHIYTMKIEPAANYQANVDGTQVHSEAMSGAVQAMDYIIMGEKTSPFLQSDFHVSEVLLVNGGAFTSVQANEGYLAWKWGLQGLLPVGHPYKNAPPT